MKVTKNDFTPQGIVRTLCKGIAEPQIPVYLEYLKGRYPGGIPLLAVMNDYPEFCKGN